MPGARSHSRSRHRSESSKSRGRPSSLTPATVKSIEKSIKAGSSYGDAAILAGVDPRTFALWMAHGRQDLQAGRASEYLHFFQVVERANIDAKAVLIERVMKGSKRDPRLALKILERRFPNEWGLKIKIEDATPDKPTSPREAFLKKLSAIEDRQERAAAALRGVLRDGDPLAEGVSGMSDAAVSNGNGGSGHEAEEGL